MRKLIVALACTLMLAGCSTKQIKITKSQGVGFTQKQADASEQTTALTKFLIRKFVRTDGVITTIGGAKSGTTTAAGNEYLSESSGLWLLHLVNTKQYAQFRTFYRATKKVLYNGKTFSYRYDSAKKKRYKVNASVDDLRIMRALIAYDEATGSKHYHAELQTIYSNWAAVCLDGGHLRNFYDNRSREASDTSSLAFYDLQTLRYLQGDTKAYRNQLRIVRAGYLGDALPLYASAYDWSGQTYSSKDLNTSEALETLLELARVGKMRTASHAWLVQQLQAKDMPNSFSTTGAVCDANQSVANWALVAQIFAAEHDAKHYDQTMRLIWRQQVTKAGSLHGGFGDPATGKAYSYSNLNILLAAEARGQAHADN
jgi:hypothetical protein